MHYLVDGYSVIHAWPELRQAMNRNLAHARDRLVGELQKYQDASGERISVFFDGRQAGGNAAPKPRKRPQPGAVEVVYSARGQSADMLIERRVASGRLPAEFSVVTADHAIQNTVGALGSSSISPDMFREVMTESLREFADWIEDHRFRTKRKFGRD